MVESMRFCDNCGAANRVDGKFCAQCGQVLRDAGDFLQAGVLSASPLIRQRYRVLQKLGEGGFGTIYQVEDVSFAGALRALKEMRMGHTDWQEKQQAIAAFKQEAMLLAGLMHPNLPRIYDHFEDRGCWYLVMDYINGKTLDTILESAPEKKLELQQVLPWAIQLCDVLSYLHDHHPPIIFRDLKPSNIMVTDEGHLYLIDFGIARLFKPGQSNDTMALGSPGYAAPEQYGKFQTTEQADVYSLGATLHHLLSGRDPGSEPFRFPPLDMLPTVPASSALGALIMQMVDMQREKRPATMQAVKHELLLVSRQLWQAGSVVLSGALSQAGGAESFPDQLTVPSPVRADDKNKPTISAFLTFHVHKDVISSLTWLPDSIHIVSGGPAFSGSGLLCWRVATSQVVRSYLEHVRALTCSPRSHVAFVADVFRIREFPSGKLIYSTISPGGISSRAMLALAWSPDGKYIACGTDNGTIILWDVISQCIFARTRIHGSEIYALDWSPDSKHLVLGCDDARICVFSLSKKTTFLQKKTQPVLEEVFTCASHYQGKVTSAAWSPDGEHIASNIGGKVYICSPFGGKGVWYGDNEARVDALAWSPDSEHIAIGNSDHTVQVWEVATGSVVATYTGHTARINTIAWSPDGNYLASGSQDHTVCVWNAS